MAEAAPFQEISLKINLNRGETHHMLADCLVRTGKPKEAIQEYQAALKINPASAPTFDGLGFAYFATGRTEEAATEFQIALGIDSSIGKTNQNPGLNFLYRPGNLDEALGHVQFPIQSRLFQACNDLGDAFLHRGMAA